jgi:hypothetical protein
MFQKEEAPAMSGAPADRGFPQRETGMDQGTIPEVKHHWPFKKRRSPAG